jgi:multiple sugar transport system substrate-binding protein
MAAIRALGFVIGLVGMLLVDWSAGVLPTEGATTKLSLWRLRTYVKAADQVLEANIQACGQQIGAAVEVQTYSFDEMWTKYTAAIESKTLPDVAELDAVGPARLYGLKRLHDVSDLVADMARDLGPVLPNAERALKFEGKYYAVPHWTVQVLLFSRKDLLAKAGVQPPDTWEELNEAARHIKAAGLQEFPMGFPWNRTGDGYDPAMSLLWSYGANWVDEQGKYRPLNTPEAVRAVKVGAEPYLKDKTAAYDYLAWDGSGNNESFMAGKITFTPNGPSILYQETVTNHPLLKETAIKIMPRGPAGRHLALTFIMSWGIPTDGKNQAKSKDLVRCIMSREMFVKYMTSSYQQATPLFQGLLEHEYWQDETGQVIVNSIKQGNPLGWPGPTTPAAAEVIARNILTDMMTRVIVDKLSPEEAVKEADRKIKEIYDRIGPK